MTPEQVFGKLNKDIKGLTSGVASASVSGSSIIFTMNDGSTQTITFPQPKDGASIVAVSTNENNQFVFSMSDGTEIVGGEVPASSGVSKEYVDSELSKKANNSDIPTKVSGLQNDSNYQTDTDVATALTPYAKSADVTKEITNKVAEIVADAPEDFNTLKEMSDWISNHENDASAMNSAISDNKTSITALQTGKADKSEIPTTVAELTDSADYAKKTDLHSHDNKSVLDGITSDKVTAWDNKSEFSGSYNDLNDKPTIDAELSNTSENAIQNKVVTKEINKLYSDISFNDHDTAKSGTSFTDAEDGNMIVTDWTKNLFNPMLKTHERYGVTCTQNVDTNGNPDGTYTLNGTSTKDRWISFGYITLKPGKYKFIATENNVRVNNLSVSLNSTVIAMSGEIFTVQSKGVYDIGLSTFDKTFNNVLIKPMLTTDLSATYDDFVPYGGYEIKSCGKNLLNPNDYIDGRNIKNDFDTLYAVNTNVDNRIWSYEESNYYFKAKTQNMTLIIDVVESFNQGGFGVFSEDGIVIYNKFSVGFPNTGIHKYVLNVEPEKMYGIMLKLYSAKVKISLYNSDETEYEPYTGETITVTNDTKSPAFGLKSHKGITNIISPGNVEVTYAKSDSGKAILDMSENKLDKSKVADVNWTSVDISSVDENTNAGATINYCIKNGICYMSILNIGFKTASQAIILGDNSIPKPSSDYCWCPLVCVADPSYSVLIHPNLSGGLEHRVVGLTNQVYSGLFSYPVAES